MLQEVFSQFPDAKFKAAVCGSGGRTIAEMLDVPYIQEVVANSIAVCTFYPQTRVAIELGGQDAKVVFFHYDEASKRLVTSDMRMNGSCAGGTGSFIDEIAALLRVPVEDFEALAAKGTRGYDISGRCGVFAKTDIQPLLNQGCSKEDIALSAFHAIAKQTIGGLSQGLELTPPIIFEGGPLTFNPRLIKVFAERLSLKGDDIIIPPHGETLTAHGVALSLDEVFGLTAKVIDPADILAKLGDYKKYIAGSRVENHRAYFSSPTERADFDERHKLPPAPVCAAQSGETVKVYLGIDAGSTTTKFVLLDENDAVIDSFYSSNKGEPLMVIKDALLDMHQKYIARGITLDVVAVGTTGYGEMLFAKAIGADYHTVETVAHAAAAQKYIPRASFILDIGGQDMKAVTISNDVVTNITVNEACSSGCGSFLENFASTLEIPVAHIAEAAFRAKNPAELGSRCTVFITSSIITEQKNGKQPDDIMAGLCRSIIENVFTKVIRISNFATLGDRIVVQGGTFKNDAVLRALEQHIGKPVIRAPYPGEMGAIGIALLTKRHIAEFGYDSPHTPPSGATRFIGFEALKTFGFTQQTNVPCGFCGNNCNRTLITFSNGTTWVTGNRCERGEYTGDKNDVSLQEKIRQITREMESIPDMIKIREELLFKEYPAQPILPKNNKTIGLPRVLDFWRNMPFWSVFFRTLGFDVAVSRKSSQKLFESGLIFVASDTVCFPAKLVHGHVHDLVEKGVDRIFLPLINRLPSDNTEAESTYTCPVLKGYGLVVQYSDNPQKRNNIPLDTPVFHWYTEKDMYRQLCNWTEETFGINRSAAEKAIREARGAQDSFMRGLEKKAAEVIAAVTEKGGFAVVLAGRHYQFDEFVNHNLSGHFTKLGIPVLTVDALPGVQKADLSKSKLQVTNNNHARLLSGALIAAQNPALEYVQIYSFGCGHDALYTDEVSRVMGEIAGKSPLILKLVESDVAGPLSIRVCSFVETVRQRREVVASQEETRKGLTNPYGVKYVKSDAKNKTVLVPNTSPLFNKILAVAFRKQGYNALPLPLSGKIGSAAGKKYLHNDICFPAQVVIGEAIASLQSGKYDTDKVAVGMAKFNCDCRLTNYTYLLRKALDDAGFHQVPIVTTDLIDSKKVHPGFKIKPLSFIRAISCLIMAETLEDLARKIRPYELVSGETDRVLDTATDAIVDALEKKGMVLAYKVYKRGLDAICKISYDKSTPKPVVFVIGEYIANYHPDCNYYIEKYLEKNNMEVEFAKMYDVFHKYMLHTISDIKDFKVHHSFADSVTAFGANAFFDFVIDLTENRARKHPLYKEAERLPISAKRSDPIMHHSINSGEAFLITAEIMSHAKEGIESFIILQPFGCLSNHICGRGVIKRIKEEFPNIQILPLDYDPDSSFTNIENRLQMLIMNARV